MQDQEEQLGFELGGEEPGPGQPNLREIREDLSAILDEARHADADGPWNPSALRYKRIVFLRLVQLLPEQEAEQLSFDFLAEVQRLEVLLAA
jgi:hypothetical protein